jgi:hypothetical protein
MKKPNFAVGQTVSLAPSKRYAPPTGNYTIVAALPNSGGPIQYRIKGELEKFERVIEEIHLGLVN